jgi:hypothetical protein
VELCPDLRRRFNSHRILGRHGASLAQLPQPRDDFVRIRRSGHSQRIGLADPGLDAATL